MSNEPIFISKSAVIHPRKTSNVSSLPQIVASVDLNRNNRDLIQINENETIPTTTTVPTVFNPISRFDSVQALPKLVNNNRQTNPVKRSNSLDFNGINDKEGNGGRKPSFFNAYLKYREMKNKLVFEKNPQETVAKRFALKPVYLITRDKAEGIINEVLKRQINTTFRFMHYSSNELEIIKKRLKIISTMIKEEIKVHCDRHYRVIVDCTLGELKQQGLIIASKCFWDENKDLAVSVKYIHHNSFFILVNVFIVYRD